MSEAVIVAIITGLFALIGNFVISRRSTDELFNRLDKESALSDEEIKSDIRVIKTEISDLKEAVGRHNKVIERTYALEQDSAVYKNQFDSIWHEIRELKAEVKRMEGKT